MHTFLQVKIAALNDSQFIGTCLYNVVVLSAVGLTLNLVLDDKVDLLYGLISGIIIVGTTATQLVVFIPKVRQNETYMCVSGFPILLMFSLNILL